MVPAFYSIICASALDKRFPLSESLKESLVIEHGNLEKFKYKRHTTDYTNISRKKFTADYQAT